MESDERSERPQTSKSDESVAKVRAAVYKNPRITLRKISEDFGFSLGSVHKILTKNLGRKRVSAKFVSKLMSASQKEARVSAANDLLE